MTNLWESGITSYGGGDIREYVEVYRQPLRYYLVSHLFHYTLCNWLGKYNWILQKTEGWPDTQCYELSNKGRILVHHFDQDGPEALDWHRRKLKSPHLSFDQLKEAKQLSKPPRP